MKYPLLLEAKAPQEEYPLKACLRVLSLAVEGFAPLVLPEDSSVTLMEIQSSPTGGSGLKLQAEQVNECTVGPIDSQVTHLFESQEHPLLVIFGVNLV